MKRIDRSYMSDVKAAFPVKTLKEKKFLKDLSQTVAEYCEEHEVLSENELIHIFGSPKNVAMQYYESISKEEYYQLIKMNKNTQKLILVGVIILFIGLIAWLLSIHEALERINREFPGTIETELVIYDDIDIFEEGLD